MASCPPPLRGFPRILDRIFAVESPGDVFDWTMLETYGTEEEKAASLAENWATFEQPTADRFSTHLERWLMSIHQTVPILFVIGPGGPLDEDAWDAWSCGELAGTLVPFLEELVTQHKKVLARDDLNDDLGDPEELAVFGRTAMSCLLQVFDQPAVKIAAALKPRVKALCEAFPID